MDGTAIALRRAAGGWLVRHQSKAHPSRGGAAKPGVSTNVPGDRPVAEGVYTAEQLSQ
jgi:hypothetical protein